MQSAQAGFPQAQTALAAELHRNTNLPPRLGLKKDFAEARKWAQLGADQNSPEAQLILAHMYREGLGVAINYELARKYCDAAIEANYGPAFTMKGICYCKGIVYQRDLKRARMLFTTAIRLGDSNGYYYLAKLYYEPLADVTSISRKGQRVDSPRGVEHLSVALHLYIQAAKTGHAHSQRELGRNWTPDVLEALARNYPKSAAELKDLRKAQSDSKDQGPAEAKHP
jgi:TPR repeat protein